MEECKNFPQDAAPVKRKGGRKHYQTGEFREKEPDYVAMAKARGFGPLVKRERASVQSIEDAEASLRRSRVVWNYAPAKSERPDVPNANTARWLAQKRKVYAPPWWLDSIEARDVSPVDVTNWRQGCFMSQRHAADFLRVPLATVKAWEEGKARIPYAVSYVMRNMPQWEHVRLNRPGGFESWGVYTDPQTGVAKLYDRENAVEFSAQQLRYFAQAMAMLSGIEKERDAFKARAEELEAENNHLRRMFKSAEVTGELHAMRDRLTEILARVNIADVVSIEPGQKVRAA